MKSSRIWNFKQRQCDHCGKLANSSISGRQTNVSSLVNAFALLMVQYTAISFYHHHLDLFIPSKSTSKSSDNAIRVCLHCVGVTLAWLYVLKNHSKEWIFLHYEQSSYQSTREVLQVSVKCYLSEIHLYFFTVANQYPPKELSTFFCN